MVKYQGKYGIWLTQNDMAIIEKALEWLENTSHTFDKISKIGAIKNLRNDLSKIRESGPQMQKNIVINDDGQIYDPTNIYENNAIQCKECD